MFKYEFKVKRFERQAFLFFFFATCVCMIVGICVLIHGGKTAGKWMGSAGLFATVAGVMQLEVSGLFQKVMEFYGDADQYPYGPPSHITSQIIDNPDRPIASWIRNTCFFNVRTGFWLIVVGTLIQVVAVWT